MFQDVFGKASASPWLIYIWNKTLGAFVPFPYKPVIKQINTQQRFILTSAIDVGRISVVLGQLFWKSCKKASQNLGGLLALFVNQEVRAWQEKSSGLSVRMQTCSTAPDPEAWLLSSPKLGHTWTFHSILDVHSRVFVFYFHCVEEFPLSVCLREKKVKLVQDSTYPCVSVMGSQMSLSFCCSH